MALKMRKPDRHFSGRDLYKRIVVVLSVICMMSMCFADAHATEQAADTTDCASAKAYSNPRFTVEEVRAYPAYYNASDGQYHYYQDIYQSTTKNITLVWLELTPETTQALLNSFNSRGIAATHWFVTIQWVASNFSKPLRYEYNAISNESGPKTIEAAYNGRKTLKYMFPVQNTTASYHDGLFGAFYYRTQYAETSTVFSGVLELNSSSSSDK